MSIKIISHNIESGKFGQLIHFGQLIKHCIVCLKIIQNYSKLSLIDFGQKKKMPNETQIQLAIASLESGEQKSLRMAATTYGVSKSVLHDRMTVNE